jgi:hypothetical protein
MNLDSVGHAAPPDGWPGPVRVVVVVLVVVGCGWGGQEERSSFFRSFVCTLVGTIV